MKERIFQSLKSSPVAWELLALFALLRAVLSMTLEKRLCYAARCYGLARTRLTQSLARRLLTEHVGHGQAVWRNARIGWSRYHYAMHDAALSRTVVIKAPQKDGEKGVMIVYFEYNFLRLLSGVQDFEEFDRQWTVVFATSWSPTDYAVLALALSLIRGKVYVQPCNHGEIEKLRSFHSRIEPLESLPCDWLHPSFYAPKKWEDRTIDILMVSNWAPFKRHWEFFRALRNLPSNLRVVCIGQPQDGCDLEHIRAMARRYKVPQEIEYLESVPIEQVTDIQCDSKVSVIFSLVEGCCVAAAESLMAGAVLAMRREAHVGPKEYINENTGILLDRGGVAAQLAEALENGGRYDSASWARENIAATRTLDSLNRRLEQDSREAGIPWTVDLAQPAWRPYPCLFHRSDLEQMEPTYAELHALYPQLFPGDLATSGRR